MILHESAEAHRALVAAQTARLASPVLDVPRLKSALRVALGHEHDRLQAALAHLQADRPALTESLLSGSIDRLAELLDLLAVRP
ncbi:hypothetical protein D9M70_481130 [compost metagenome]